MQFFFSHSHAFTAYLYVKYLVYVFISIFTLLCNKFVLRSKMYAILQFLCPTGLGSQQSSQATTASALTGGSTPYPFYPDRQGLDPSKFPGSNPNPDNEVKWYYSNYNSENLDPYKDPDPYVDPRIPRDQDISEAAKVSPSSSSQTYHCNFSLVIVMLSLPIYMLNI